MSSNLVITFVCARTSPHRSIPAPALVVLLVPLSKKKTYRAIVNDVEVISPLFFAISSIIHLFLQESSSDPETVVSAGEPEEAAGAPPGLGTGPTLNPESAAVGMELSMAAAASRTTARPRRHRRPQSRQLSYCQVIRRTSFGN